MVYVSGVELWVVSCVGCRVEEDERVLGGRLAVETRWRELFPRNRRASRAESPTGPPVVVHVKTPATSLRRRYAINTRCDFLIHDLLSLPISTIESGVS